MILSGNAWADCAEVEALQLACVNGTPTGLEPDSVICKAALQYCEVCRERDKFCQDPTKHWPGKGGKRDLIKNTNIYY
jgi:hypothetical protein